MSVLVEPTVCLTALTNGDHRILARNMSAPGLTSEAQLRYILQWFGEFSELQREDFVPILAAARTDKPDYLAATLERLSCQDKPVSLFQCRIKLFNEWYPTWAEEEQDRLVKGVTDMDPEFGAKLQEIMINGLKVNGDMNGFNGIDSSLDEEHKDSDDVSVHEEIEPEIVHEEETPAVPQDNIPVEIVAAS